MLAKLSNVTKTYHTGEAEVRVLSGCDFSVDETETVAITGPSGSGKSTLLNLLGAMDQPDEGEVVVDGLKLAELNSNALAAFRNRQIGFVFQLHHLLPHCSVLENVLVPTLAHPTTTPEREALEQRARQLLDSVGLSHRSNHRPGQISGGERQRAAVARALIQSPKLLLADEPTGALDRGNATKLADLLVELNAKEKVAIVMVTHAQDLAKRMGRVLSLTDGKLAPVGPE